MSTSVSRWWYGVAMTTLFGVLLYIFALIFILIGPNQPAGSEGELVVKVLSLVATAIIAFTLHIMTVIYVISFALDWYYISTTTGTEWSPTRWYLTIPLAALGNFITPVITTPVITIGGAYYLFKRSQMVGKPDFSGLTGNY